MQIKPFRIEHYFGKYEFTAKYLLSCSDAESRTIKELLDLEPGAHERVTGIGARAVRTYPAGS